MSATAGGLHRIALRKDSWDLKNPQPENPEKPTPREAYRVIMRTVETIDEDLMKGYKEDIDTLLVFAGLFSGVVTAFTIESYQWLQEDPADKSAKLLAQMVQQMSGQTPTPYVNFVLDPAVVRINTYWFLSLTLALVDALFGLLCKQWVREYQRPASTHTPGQALALRWMRYQSFEKWHGPAILASLPILLEIALFLFLAGVLELLFTRHHTPFATALVVVGLAIIFYLATTILPGLSIIREVSRIHPTLKNGIPFDSTKIPHVPTIDFICPYKSPQSWLMLRLFSAIYQGLGQTLMLNILELSDWSSLDLKVIQRFSNIERCPDLYILKGFRWLVRQTRDMPSMRPCLKSVLEELPLHLVMPSVFDRWDLPNGKTTWSAADIDSALNTPQGPDNLFSDSSTPQQLSLASQILCFRHSMATHRDWARFDEKGDQLTKAAEDLWYRVRKTPGLARALFHPQDLLICQSGNWCKNILDFYRRHWEELDVLSQVKLVARLSESILSFMESPDHDVNSTLFASRDSLPFFTSLNDKISGTKRFYKFNFCTQPWMDVLHHLRNIHRLPLDYFKPIPGYFLIPANQFKTLLDNSSTAESVVEPLLNSGIECWDRAHSSQKEELIKSLSDHIKQIPLELSTEASSTSESIYAPSSQQPPTTSVFVTSHRGLEFLTFINGALATRIDFEDSESMSDTIHAWVEALERIRLLRRLSADYFTPIPDWRSSNYSTSTNEAGGINTEVVEDLDPEPDRTAHVEGGTRIETGIPGAGHIEMDILNNHDGGRRIQKPDTGQVKTADGHGVVGGLGAENNV